jgi:hypothetical protein
MSDSEDEEFLDFEGQYNIAKIVKIQAIFRGVITRKKLKKRQQQLN